MATTTVGPSSGGRGKPLNIEYNLVPFIDLLSCCIAFLLMTAVWIQISIMQTNEGTSDAPASKNDVTLALYIFKDRQDISVSDGKSISISKISSGYDMDKLFNELKLIQKSHANKKDILILAQDKVLYKELIASIDKCNEAGFPNITVSGMLE